MDVENKISSKLVYDGRIIKVYLDDIEMEKAGKLAKREVVKHNGAVCALVKTEDDKIMFVRQYRYAVSDALLELPAGKIDGDEEPDQAILRELKEEVGVVAKSIHKMGKIYSSPGFCNEMLYLYYVDEYDRCNTDFDDDEDLDLELYTFEEVNKMFENGKLIDAKSATLFYKVKDFLNK